MKISVIVPFHNLQEYVEKTLDTVVKAVRNLISKRQDCVIELICIDDGSNDDTGRLLDEKLSGIDIGGLECSCIHQENAGEGEARNAGLMQATGDWITFLDGDDIWAEDYFVRFLELLDRYPDADIVGQAKKVFRTGTVEFDRLIESEIVAYDVTTQLPLDVLLGLGICPTLIRRTIADGLHFTQLVLGADRVYMAACIARARRVVLSDLVVYGYRYRPNSMAHCARSAAKITSYQEHALQLWRLLSDSGKTVDRGCVDFIMTHLMVKMPIKISRVGDETASESLWTDWENAVKSLSPLPCSLKWRLLRKIELRMASARSLNALLARFIWRLGLLGTRKGRML